MTKWKWVLVGILVAVTANVYAQAKPEHEPLKPRVTPESIKKAKAMKPPMASSPAVIAEGKALFTGKATCFVCHGMEGKGDGPGAAGTTVGPRNFTNPAFHKAKSCGELFWVASNGSLGDHSKEDPSHEGGTGMVPYLQGHESELEIEGTPTVNEEELWKIVHFEASLGGAKC